MASGFLYTARTKSYQGHGKLCTMESSIIRYESYSIAALTVRGLVESGMNVNVIECIFEYLYILVSHVTLKLSFKRFSLFRVILRAVLYP